MTMALPSWRTGLSPRLRGNLNLLCCKDGWLGSIPALTGKPIRGSIRRAAARVYPRAYGETAFTSAA